MKNKLIIAYLALCLGISACFDDKGNYDYEKLPNVTVSGIDSVITAQVGEKLYIPANVKEDLVGENEYFWLISRVKDYRDMDTLSREKELNQVIHLPVSSYYAMYQVQDVNTRVIKQTVKFKLHVINENGKGWLLLTNEGNTSNVTMIVTTKAKPEIKSNLLSHPVDGVATAFAYIPSHAYYKWENGGLNEKVNHVFVIGTEKDMKFYNADTYEVEREFKDLFSDQFMAIPAAKNPTILPGDQLFWDQTSSPSFTLVNDGKFYLFNGEKDFTGMILSPLGANLRSVNNLFFSPVGGGHGVSFDPNANKFFDFGGSKAGSYTYIDDPRLDNITRIKMCKPAVFAGGIAEYTVLINDVNQIPHLYNMAPANDWGDMARISSEFQNLTPDIADRIANSPYFLLDCSMDNESASPYRNYYLAGNTIYTLIHVNNWDGTSTGSESSLYTFTGAGEQVTAMNYFSDYLWNSGFSKLVVATHDGKIGKLYIFTFDPVSGEMNTSPEIHTGVGKVIDIRYRDSFEMAIKCVQ